jgi:hypothetical protein
MPAKAGIQCLARNWMPAYAGMSGEYGVTNNEE